MKPYEKRTGMTPTKASCTCGAGMEALTYRLVRTFADEHAQHGDVTLRGLGVHQRSRDGAMVDVAITEPLERAK